MFRKILPFYYYHLYEFYVLKCSVLSLGLSPNKYRADHIRICNFLQFYHFSELHSLKKKQLKNAHPARSSMAEYYCLFLLFYLLREGKQFSIVYSEVHFHLTTEQPQIILAADF